MHSLRPTLPRPPGLAKGLVVSRPNLSHQDPAGSTPGMAAALFSLACLRLISRAFLAGTLALAVAFSAASLARRSARKRTVLLACSSCSLTLSHWNALFRLLFSADLNSVFDLVGRIMSLSYGRRAINACTSSAFTSRRLTGKAMNKS